MKLKSDYKVFGSWARDLETPRQLAVRTLALTRSLARLTPAFATWYHVDYEIEDSPPLGEDLDEIARRIGYQGKDPDPPQMGFFSQFFNIPDDSEGWRMFFQAGGAKAQCLDLMSWFDGAPDEDAITFDIARGAIRSIRDTFEAEWCAAFPLDLLINQDRYLRVRSSAKVLPRAWMIELSPRLAAHVEPPPHSRHEYLSDGSLFMTATYETFVTQNPEHLAAAEEIFGVIDPLNFIPKELPLA